MTEEEFKYEFKWFKDDFHTDPKSRGRLFEIRSEMEQERSEWDPPVPCVFSSERVECEKNSTGSIVLRASSNIATAVKKRGKLSVGVILTGEWVPGSGTHNVIVGIVRYCENFYEEIKIFGFLGGPQGFARKHYVHLTGANVSKYLNQGGADLLGFGSLSAITEKDFCEIHQLCRQEYELDSLIFVGGPTEMAHVSQLLMFPPLSDDLNVIGVFQSPNAAVYQPEWIPVTLGFDSACSALAEYVGNIAMDVGVINLIRCGSATATMEVALRVSPPVYPVIAEELVGLDLLLEKLKNEITTSNTTTILISDKFYQFLPGLNQLRAECRSLYSRFSNASDLLKELSPPSFELLRRFPPADQLRIARGYDQDGNPTFPETCPEKWLAQLLQETVLECPPIRTHCIGAETRCVFPTNFDCALGLALGQTAAALASSGCAGGYIAAVRNLHLPVTGWECGGFPLKSLLQETDPKRNEETGLVDQFGGANQELINLARQRQIRESRVPVIRKENFLYHGTKKISINNLFQPLPYSFNEPFSHSGSIVGGERGVGGRKNYEPKYPKKLSEFDKIINVTDCAVTTHASCLSLVQLAFPNTSSVSAVSIGCSSPTSPPPMRVGIVFMGRPVAGTHNVVAGLSRSLARGSQIVGFINGAQGLINAHYRELSESEIAQDFLNTGGNRMLGRSDNPIRTKDELHACVTTCKKIRLQGLLVVGGLGTHADTALLAEAVAAHRLPTRVLGVPASIENDIPLVEQSLGHDTACRVYSSIVGALAALAASKKRGQWCFVRISGKRSSMLMSELALQTHASLVLTSEELKARRMSIADVVNLICDLISLRAKNGADFGIVIFPESVLDDTHAPEILLESLVGEELHRRRSIGCSSSSSVFRSSTHVISHSQGRNSYPSNFDCDLGFTLGLFAGILIANEKTGLLVTVENLAKCSVAQDWEPLGVPLTSLLQIHLDKESLACSMFIQQREADFCMVEKMLPNPAMRRFLNPGPLQFRDNLRLKSLKENSPQLVRQRILVEKVSALCSQIMSIGSSATDQQVRDVLTTGLAHTLALMKAANRGTAFHENNDKTRTDDNDLLRPGGNNSHNRVIQLVPVDRYTT